MTRPIRQHYQTSHETTERGGLSEENDDKAPAYDWEQDAKDGYTLAIAKKREAWLVENIPGVKRAAAIGRCELLLGDCLEILPHLQQVDAVVTDPPYGIGADEAAAKNKGKWGWTDYGESEWDRARPDREVFDFMAAASKEQIIWGGNYFTDYLPPTMRWLIWDKGQRDFSLADFEIAWTSQQKAARILNYPRAKALQDGKKHPTQKPVAVMLWCLGFVPNADTILDPFLGSGTTLVACAKLGRRGIGIELDEGYFDIACNRVEEAYRQPDLFVQPPAAPVQTSIFDEVEE